MDTKVSALVPATTLNTSDYLLLVQSGNSLKIDIQTFLTHLPSKLSVIEATESPLSGAISTILLVSKLNVTTPGVAYTLAAGTHGMEKQLVVANFATSGTAVVTVTNGTGFTTLTFNALQDTARLKNIDGKWYVIASNSIVVA